MISVVFFFWQFFGTLANLRASRDYASGGEGLFRQLSLLWFQFFMIKFKGAYLGSTS